MAGNGKSQVGGDAVYDGVGGAGWYLEAILEGDDQRILDGRNGIDHLPSEVGPTEQVILGCEALLLAG